MTGCIYLSHWKQRPSCLPAFSRDCRAELGLLGALQVDGLSMASSLATLETGRLAVRDSHRGISPNSKTLMYILLLENISKETRGTKSLSSRVPIQRPAGSLRMEEDSTGIPEHSKPPEVRVEGLGALLEAELCPHSTMGVPSRLPNTRNVTLGS